MKHGTTSTNPIFEDGIGSAHMATPYSATVEILAPVAADASVAFRGNRYSVPPGLAGLEMQLRHRLGSATLEIHSPAGVLLGHHRLAPAGSGALVRSAEHRVALEAVVLSGDFA
jgi:hypothetical protein